MTQLSLYVGNPVYLMLACFFVGCLLARLSQNG